MATRDRLILPPPALAGCLYGALLRDTRGRGLTGPALYNHFPASPLVAVTWVFHGRLHMVEDGLVCADPLPAISISGTTRTSGLEILTSLAQRTTRTAAQTANAMAVNSPRPSCISAISL